MRKQVLLYAMAALAFFSCSDNQSDSISVPSQIAFLPSVGSMTRAISTTSSLSQFNVNAYLVQGEQTMRYISDLSVNKVNGVWNSGSSYTWPYSGDIRFYSFAPNTLEVEMPSAEAFATKAPSFKYVASSNPERQLDVLYAVNNVNTASVYKGGVNAKTVNVNFRHALAQVVFCAKNTNPEWLLDISDVQIVNLKSNGVYTFPTATTMPLESDKTDVRGSWELDNDLHSYITSFEDVQNIGDDVVPLTTSASGAILVLPQKSVAWDPFTDPNCVNNGTYFMIRCKIQKVTPDGNALLWPSKSTDTSAYVAIPVSVDWKEGKKYTYTFIFGDGAGYIPPKTTEAGEPAVPGAETLSKIDFSVSVDDFQSATEHDVNM